MKPALMRFITITSLTLLSVIYLITMAQTSVGFADSDELISIGYHGGVVHAPGYPLATAITWLVTNSLDFIESIATRAHLIAVLFNLATVVVIIIASRLIIEFLKYPIKPHTRDLISLGSGLILGTSYLFWQYSLVWEVMALNNLLSASIVASTFYLLQKPQSLYRYLLLAIILGLALSHHHTSILLFPGVILLLVEFGISKLTPRQIANRLILSASTFIIILLSLTSSLLLFNQQAQVSWQFEPSLSGWWAFVSRSLYSGYTSSGEYISGAYWSGINLSQNLTNLKRYVVEYMPEHLGIIFFILLIIGLYYLIKQSPIKQWLGLILLFGLPSTGIGFYLVIPHYSSLVLDDLILRAMTERMYLMGYVVLTPLISISLVWIYSNLKQQKLKADQLLFGLILFTVTVQIWSNFDTVNLFNYSFSQNTHSATLESLPQNSRLVCFSDWSCFGLMYAHSVMQSRPDIEIYMIPDQLRYINQTNNDAKPAFASNPHRIIEIVWQGTTQNQQVFATEILPLYNNLIGIDENTVIINPLWFANQINCDQNLNLETKIPNWVLAHANTDLDNRSSYMLIHQAIVREQLRLISRLNLSGLECTDSATLYNTAKKCFSEDDQSCALRFGLWYYLKYPADQASQDLLRKIYAKYGFSELNQIFK